MENTNNYCKICKLGIKKDDDVLFCEYCGRQFHRKHLLEWLHVNNICPVCREVLDQDKFKDKPVSQGIEKAIEIARKEKIATLKEDLKFLEDNDMSRKDKREEITLVVGCRKEQISFIEEEVLQKAGEIKFYCGDLHLGSLISAEGLVLPEYISGSLNLKGLKSAEGLVLPEYISGSLNLKGLKSVEGLTFPLYVGSLDLSYLESAKESILPLHIEEGSLDLKRLTSVEGLVLPEYISGYLNFNGLTSAEGLVFPENMKGSLNLGSLISAEGLVLPEYISGSLNLKGLKSAEGLVLPLYVGGEINLYGLASIEGLTFPRKFKNDDESVGLGSLFDDQIVNLSLTCKR